MNQATTNYYNDYILLEWQNFVSDPSRAPEARVHFLRGSAEDLSFPDGVFDAVICRLALPYTDNSQALAEASRVLRHELKRHGLVIQGNTPDSNPLTPSFVIVKSE